MAAELNRTFAYLPPELSLDYCEACGASRAIVPVGGTSGRWCECRECHSLVRAKGMEK